MLCPLPAPTAFSSLGPGSQTVSVPLPPPPSSVTIPKNGTGNSNTSQGDWAVPGSPLHLPSFLQMCPLPGRGIPGWELKLSLSPQGILSAFQVQVYARPWVGASWRQRSLSRGIDCVGHRGLWKSPRILESGSLGLGLNRMRQLRGGSWVPSWGLYTCLHLGYPGP